MMELFLLNSAALFGIHFAHDMPGPLQGIFQEVSQHNEVFASHYLVVCTVRVDNRTLNKIVSKRTFYYTAVHIKFCVVYESVCSDS